MTDATVRNMTTEEATRIGVQQYRDGKTFANADVRPAGFFAACVRNNRIDLVDALDRGWHTAHLAEPVVMDDGEVVALDYAARELEAICGVPDAVTFAHRVITCPSCESANTTLASTYTHVTEYGTETDMDRYSCDDCGHEFGW